MVEPHQLLVRGGQVELLIKKSRFLGFAAFCGSEDEARSQLESARKADPKANHHVYAWRLLDDETGQISCRSDDDGEPGGTSGRPVLQVLESHRLVNAQIIVVRYFGGIKLGAGGLVRAYGEAAAKAVAAAELKTLIVTEVVHLTVPFTQISTIEHWVNRDDVVVIDREFDDKATLIIELPEAMVSQMKTELINLTGGSIRFSV